MRAGLSGRELGPRAQTRAASREFHTAQSSGCERYYDVRLLGNAGADLLVHRLASCLRKCLGSSHFSVKFGEGEQNS